MMTIRHPRPGPVLMPRAAEPEGQPAPRAEPNGRARPAAKAASFEPIGRIGGRPSIERIKALVADEFGVPLIEMVSARRHREVARPRQVAMNMACRFTLHSLPAIGRRFGGRDHTTVIGARRRIEELRAADPAFDARVRRIEQRLEPPPPPPQREEVQLAFLIGPLFDRPLELAL